MISWHMYSNDRNSLDVDEQRAAQPPIKTGFYEDEYWKMVTRMDREKAVSSKNWKTSDPFGELLKLSVLADGGYRSGGSRDLGFVHNLRSTDMPP